MLKLSLFFIPVASPLYNPALDEKDENSKNYIHRHR